MENVRNKAIFEAIYEYFKMLTNYIFLERAWPTEPRGTIGNSYFWFDSYPGENEYAWEESKQKNVSTLKIWYFGDKMSAH